MMDEHLCVFTSLFAVFLPLTRIERDLGSYDYSFMVVYVRERECVYCKRSNVNGEKDQRIEMN